MGASRRAKRSRQHEIHKSMGNKDRFLELPEGILCSIISKLTLKEALKTSSLSTAWRFVWTCHPNLLFDFECVFENRAYSRGSSDRCPDMMKQFYTCKFVERVNQIMDQRFKGPKIDSLTIRFNLGEDHSSDITRWIDHAVLKGVKEIDLDLLKPYDLDPYSSRYERYAFCCTLLASSENECTVKHLRLASCSLSSISWPNSLKSLVTVVLRDVRINDLEIKSFLMICPSLERLTLSNCQDLVNIQVTGLGVRLKFLHISNCLRLMTITICAEDLVVLEYTGQWVKFFFKSVPRLTKMFLSFARVGREEGIAYALSGLANDVPQLESLNVGCLASLKSQKFAENAHTIANVQQLVLTVRPFLDDDELVWVGYILKAFPMLQKLDINLFSPIYTLKSTGINRHLPETPHEHLTHLVVNGFNGYSHEVELVKYLLENAIGLEVLVINRWKRVYKGFENWDDERLNTYFKLSEEIVEWLYKGVAPNVDLRIHD